MLTDKQGAQHGQTAGPLHPEGSDMAEPFARLEWRGKPLICYLQPGCVVHDIDALVGEIGHASTACCTEAEFDAELDAIAARHDLGLAHAIPGVPGDAVERILSFGFLPPLR